MLDLFVCHSSEDHGFVTWLSKELVKKGVTVWVDEGEIRVGDSLIGKIEEGMARTRFFAVVLSKKSMNSPWVKKELEMAITKEVLEKKSNSVTYCNRRM
ncbi:toll/interleukin-1 receptor domain-containing protein [Candidatus Bathyarchaeota archaeon]|nr:toll/interleukin-1 receptor domain-containing protein [Candidatus Bathyarchaeota archaeon]